MIEHLQDLDEVKRIACELAAEPGALTVHNTAGEREVKNKLATGLKNPKIRKAASG